MLHDRGVTRLAPFPEHEQQPAPLQAEYAALPNPVVEQQASPEAPGTAPEAANHPAALLGIQPAAVTFPAWPLLDCEPPLALPTAVQPSPAQPTAIQLAVMGTPAPPVPLDTLPSSKAAPAGTLLGKCRPPQASTGAPAWESPALAFISAAYGGESDGEEDGESPGGSGAAAMDVQPAVPQVAAAGTAADLAAPVEQTAAPDGLHAEVSHDTLLFVHAQLFYHLSLLVSLASNGRTFRQAAHAVLLYVHDIARK